MKPKLQSNSSPIESSLNNQAKAIEAEASNDNEDDSFRTSLPDFDKLLDCLGQFGTYQKWLYFLLWIPAASMAIGIYSTVFLEFVPNHKCLVDCKNGAMDDNDWMSQVKDPSCTMPRSLNETCTIQDVQDVIHCDKFAYDQSLFTDTAVSEFNAVCGSGYLRTISSTMYMSGMLFGSLFFGWISDAMGRRVAFGLCVLCLSLGSTLAAFSTNYTMFMVLRFITSMGGIGSFMISFVMATEFVGTKYRTLCGILIEVPFALGELYIVLLAYFIRDWRSLQLAIGVPLLGLVFYLVKLPESIRWAWAVGKFSTANKVIESMSRINKVPVPEEFLIENDAEENLASSPAGSSSADVGMGPLMKSKPLRGRLIVMVFNWIVATLCYYGLSLNAGIGSDVFSAFSLSALMEIPAYCLSAMSVGLWGRKPFLMFVQILCGISCILAGLFDDLTIRLAFSLIGKFGSAAAFSIVFLYTAELFPTSMRNSAVGMCSTLARFGGILAPTVAQLGHNQPKLPFMIFGTATLIGGVAAYLLPETKGKKLPDTVQEAVDMVEKEPSSE